MLVAPWFIVINGSGVLITSGPASWTASVAWVVPPVPRVKLPSIVADGTVGSTDDTSMRSVVPSVLAITTGKDGKSTVGVGKVANAPTGGEPVVSIVMVPSPLSDTNFP